MTKTNSWNFDTTFTAGDLLYASDTSTLAKLGVGASDEIVRLDTGIPSWDTEDLDASYLITGNNASCHNLILTISGTTLTLKGISADLSSTNKATVFLPSNANAGRWVKYQLSSNITLSASTLDGNTFGTTASVAWGSDMPMYFGFMADANDENLVAVLARYPVTFSSPSVSTDIGDPSAANADKETSVFSWTDITEADYTSKSVGLIGSLIMTKNASDQWTFVLDSFSGVGNWQERYQFVFPVSQNGSASGKQWADNGGTAPTFGSTDYRYYISRNGVVKVNMNFQAVTSAGSGAVVAYISLPYGNPVNNLSMFGLYFDNSGAVYSVAFMRRQVLGSNSLLSLVLNGGTASATNAAFALDDTFWLGGTMMLNLGVT